MSQRKLQFYNSSMVKSGMCYTKIYPKQKPETPEPNSQILILLDINSVNAMFNQAICQVNASLIASENSE